MPSVIEKLLRDDYDLVADGLVNALDTLDQVERLLRAGLVGEALAVIEERKDA